MACKNDQAILVVSFGTSYNDNRSKTIGAVERLICENYSDEWDVRRAFTSKMIIRKLAERDGKKVDYISDAMERLVADGAERVMIQPTHIMNGKEFDDVARIAGSYRDRIPEIRISAPLLTTEEDYDAVVEALERTVIAEARSIAGEDCSIILVGHGTEHYANASYSQLQLKLMLSGHRDVFVTTIEGFPGFDDTMELMEGRGRNVVLFPFMLVAGDHANNDIAGDEEDSLKSILQSKGYDVHCIVKGLGEYPDFRELFLEHLRSIVHRITD